MACFLARIEDSVGRVYFQIRDSKTGKTVQWLGRYPTKATPEKIRAACRKHRVRIGGELIPKERPIDPTVPEPELASDDET